MALRTVAVTGASGFIGSPIVKDLLDTGFAVRGNVRDANDASKTEHLLSIAESSGAIDSLSLYSGDLMEPESYDEAFSGADAVIHTVHSMLHFC